MLADGMLEGLGPRLGPSILHEVGVVRFDHRREAVVVNVAVWLRHLLLDAIDEALELALCVSARKF
jgi:hypothetical protein